MVLAQLCNGYMLRWPMLLGEWQTPSNPAVHSSTGATPYVAYERYRRAVFERWPEVVPCPGSKRDGEGW